MLTERPNGTIEEIERDDAGRITRKVDAVGWMPFMTYEYAYDANGNIIEQYRHRGYAFPGTYYQGYAFTEYTDIYTYDALDRLTGKNEQIMSYEPCAQTYMFDAGGNMDYGINPHIYGYGAGNRLDLFDGHIEISYDADGNMTHGPLSGWFVDFEYDSLNRLVKAGDWEFAYDGEGNRSSGNGTTYVTDPHAELSQILMTTAENGDVTYYVYGLGLISQEKHLMTKGRGEFE